MATTDITNKAVVYNDPLASRLLSPSEIGGIIDGTYPITLSGSQSTIMTFDFRERYIIESFSVFSDINNIGEISIKSGIDGFDYIPVSIIKSSGELKCYPTSPRFIQVHATASGTSFSISNINAICNGESIKFGIDGNLDLVTITDAPVNGTSENPVTIPIFNNEDSFVNPYVCIDKTGGSVDNQIEISLHPDGPFYGRTITDNLKNGIFINTHLTPSGTIELNHNYDGYLTYGTYEGPVIEVPTDYDADTDISFLTSLGSICTTSGSLVATVEVRSSNISPSTNSVVGARENVSLTNLDISKFKANGPGVAKIGERFCLYGGGVVSGIPSSSNHGLTSNSNTVLIYDNTNNTKWSTVNLSGMAYMGYSFFGGDNGQGHGEGSITATTYSRSLLPTILPVWNNKIIAIGGALSTYSVAYSASFIPMCVSSFGTLGTGGDNSSFVPTWDYGIEVIDIDNATVTFPYANQYNSSYSPILNRCLYGAFQDGKYYYMAGGVSIENPHGRNGVTMAYTNKHDLVRADLSTNPIIFTTIKDFTTARIRPFCAVWNNYVYVVGGRTIYNGLQNLTTGVFFDLNNLNVNYSLPNLPIALCGGSAFIINDQLVLAGGIDIYSKMTNTFYTLDLNAFHAGQNVSWVAQNMTNFAFTSYDYVGAGIGWGGYSNTTIWDGNEDIYIFQTSNGPWKTGYTELTSLTTTNPPKLDKITINPWSSNNHAPHDGPWNNLPWEERSINNCVTNGRYKQYRITLRSNSNRTETPKILNIYTVRVLRVGEISPHNYKNIYARTTIPERTSTDLEHGRLKVWWNTEA